MRLLVTRPREDAEPFAAALAARGIATLIEPMLTIVDVPGPPLDRGDLQAILFTSANGVRALVRRNGGDLSDLAAVPALAVGDATGAAARAAGFRRVDSAAGDVEALTTLAMERLSPAGGPLLHVAGSRVAGDLAGRLNAAGFTVRRAALYDARKATALSAATRHALRHTMIDAVTFFSPRTAAAFVSLCGDAETRPLLARTVALCLSQAVARAAEAAAWRAVIVAARPDQEALLACLENPVLRTPRA